MLSYVFFSWHVTFWRLLFRGAVEMSLVERFSVLRSIGVECIDEDELRLLVDRKAAPVCYVWFVPSPRKDIAQVQQHKVL